MPGFDGTGPMGAGPMTGGRRGFCNAASIGYVPQPASGYGYGRGLGLGRGFRRGFGPGIGLGRGYAWGTPVYGQTYPISATDEINMLRSQANDMKRALDDINKRIEELEKDTPPAASG